MTVVWQDGKLSRYQRLIGKLRQNGVMASGESCGRTLSSGSDAECDQGCVVQHDHEFIQMPVPVNI